MSKIQESLDKIFKDHRVVFWYDDQEKMREQYEEISLKGIQKVEINNNEFAIKHQILRKEPKAKFLLYFPLGEKPPLENWLLDLQLAHKEFHTDQEAMYLQEMGLDYYFKELVQKHIEFFHNKDRKNKLKELVAEGDQGKDLQFKMMAVVFNTAYPNLEAYIQAYAAAYINGNDKIERELERFNLNNIFWKMVAKKFNFEQDNSNIYDFLLDVFSRNFSPTNKGRSVKETRILLSLWKDTISYREAFNGVSDKVANDLNVTSILNKTKLDDLIQDDLFRNIDKKIIRDLAVQLASDDIQLDKVLTLIKKRENKYWYHEFKNFYACLEHASQLFNQIKKYKHETVASIESAVSQYTEEQYLIDFSYRKFIYYYRQSGQNSVLNELYEKVLKTYTNDWLLPVNNKLQDHIATIDHWVHESPKAQSGFFKNKVKEFTIKPQRLFVVISDALRYENGWQLYQELQSEKRYEADIDYMITGLPSYTQLGMAALLPHQQLVINKKDCTVQVDGISAVGIQGRSKVLQKKSGVRATAILAEEFMNMNSATEGRSFVKEYDLIYIYHNRIDKTGDDSTSEDKVFEAVEEEVLFLKELLRKIGNVNGYHTYITSDHGYIYQHDVLETSDFAVSEAKGDIWKESRRFILGSNLKASSALKHFKGDKLGLTKDTEVLVTKGINRLRVRGAGSRFVHGGASLQEVVVPLIKVSRKKSDTTKQVTIDIIKSTDKIPTNILVVSFLQKELVGDKILSRQIRASIRAEDDTVLSDIFNYTFDATEGTERQREIKHSFQLSALASGKYKNQRVSLILEEPVEGSSQWKTYQTYYYTLEVSFMNDFDDF